MNSLTFLNAGFWPWLLALGIPILIHLLTRRTRRVTALPTLTFLRRSLAQQSQMFRMRRWLLLALRLMLLFFLVLTFLKPTLTAPLDRAKGEKRAVVLVLDVSLSMGATRGGVTALARAQGQAMTLLDGLRVGDSANVILAGATPRAVLNKPGSHFGALRQAVQSAQPTTERGDLPAAVALAVEQLLATEITRKELLLASDFQRTNWADARLDALPSDVKVVYLNSDAGERENAALTGLRMRPATPHAGEEAALIAEVWNGSRAARSLSVSLAVQAESGADLARRNLPPQTISVPPFATGTVSFPITFPEAGSYRITAKLPPDSLPADDTRYLLADLRHSLKALLLTDSPLNGSAGAAFLARALNPTPALPGGVRVLPRRATDLTQTDLKTCDVVLWCGLETLPADKLPLLARYVQEGGSLLIFLSGERVLPQMQALAKQAKSGEGLPFLPQVLLDATKQGKGFVTLTEARYDSPLLKLFKDPNVADLGKIRFYRFYITGEPDPKTEVLLKFEDGTTAAAWRNFGAGSILMCNFSPAPGESDLARQEVFPPLLHEFLKGMTRSEGERREFYPGGLASTTLDANGAQGTAQAVGPNGETEKVLWDRTSGSVILERASAPGFHRVLINARSVATLAVNTHPDESDLRALDPRELQDRQRSGSSYMVEAGRQGAAAELQKLQRGVPLWPYCLLLAFAALLLEHAVAAFGSRTRVLDERHNRKNR
jgi:hypothetical protein